MIDIDLRENAVVRPLLQEAEQRGRQEQLLTMLAEKFGALPAWAGERIHRAPPAELDRWARRFVRAASLEETFD